MNWFNFKLDGRPNHHEELLISINGVYHVVFYDAERDRFISKRDVTQVFDSSEDNIYWAKIIPPSADNAA